MNSPGVMNLFTIPNIITMMRIVLLPIYLYLFVQGNYYLAAGLFSLSALSDFVDGYIAKKFNMHSKFGKLLDPLADKLTIISVLLLLIRLNLIPRVVSLIILGRELFIFFSGIITYFFGLNFIDPTLLGKASVFLLYTAIAVRLIGINFFGNWLFYLVIPINIISAVDYFIKAYRKVFA
ncbi:CDP-alcohol phosphatidyltransferase family protein [Halanaerobium hydrogeniformans]|uniref:Phosphatidylglycerophosphate synthase n=1 Tax=Halanaerobium hydrogeniformans TaxID=656519 RepID=E4RLP6_HALHG|nr:CDP-alcohol phosphatidyltransferase family protein [Halanaerobium hydrogeniformans]ADQ14960.1 CDP-alcohol phosphatidyltransferase [Halanaerobium hydrogeniformans]